MDSKVGYLSFRVTYDFISRGLVVVAFTFKFSPEWWSWWPPVPGHQVVHLLAAGIHLHSWRSQGLDFCFHRDLREPNKNNRTKRNETKKGRIGRWCGSYWMNWHQVRLFGQGKLPQLRRFEFNKNHLSTKNSWTLKNWWFGKRNFHVWGVHVSFQGCSCVHVGRWLSECIRYFSIFEDEFHGCFNCSFRSSKIESWLCKNNLCVQWYLYIPGIEGCVIFLCDFACSTSGWISVGGLPFRSLKGKEDLCIIIIRWVRLSMSGNPKSYG